MVITRVENKGIINKTIDQQEFEELQALASKGISEEEINSVINEFELKENKIEAIKSFEMKREEFKTEKAKENFKSGAGSFRRK